MESKIQPEPVSVETWQKLTNDQPSVGWCEIVAVLTLVGRTPFVLATLAYGAQAIAAGASGLRVYEQSLRKCLRPLKQEASMSVFLPLMAFVAFGSLFVLANPDLFASFSHCIHQCFRRSQFASTGRGKTDTVPLG